MNKADDSSKRTERTPRRSFTIEQKRAILLEADSTSVWATGKKYEISSAVLFKWRKELTGSRKVRITPLSKESRVNDLKESLLHIQQLETIGISIIGKLGADLMEKRVSSYNATIALATLVSSANKMSGLKKDLLERIDAASQAQEKAQRDNLLQETPAERKLRREYGEHVLLAMLQMKERNPDLR